MSVNRTSLGKRISFYRSKSNLTQEVLAAKVNCSREYIVQNRKWHRRFQAFLLLSKLPTRYPFPRMSLLLDCLDYSIFNSATL